MTPVGHPLTESGFSRTRRVRSRADFRQIQDKGRRVNTPSFVLLIQARADDTAPARLGITASKRVGNAVIRNRVKRIVRAAFRHAGDLFEAGLDVVVIARPQAARLSSPRVLEEWQSAARRLRKAAQEARDQRPPSAGGAAVPPAKRHSP